ncbi:hypothetical protein [Aphanizomenon sp. UHCC 0183]|nr:hypothetical protein [Aphanizomenon sp. UHCC 0183]
MRSLLGCGRAIAVLGMWKGDRFCGDVGCDLCSVVVGNAIA